MMSLQELDRFCAATLAGPFGLRVLSAADLHHHERRSTPANIDNCLREATASAARRGFEQGNL